MTAGAGPAVSSDYIWRGFLENQTLSVQPNLWMTIGDVTFSSWMNASRVGPNGRSFTERDVTLDYTHALGSWTYPVGGSTTRSSRCRWTDIQTSFSGRSPTTAISPTLHLDHDVQQGSGSYISLDVTHEYPIWRPGITLSPQVSLGYNHRQWIDASTWAMPISV
jgi:hypothetical protein